MENKQINTRLAELAKAGDHNAAVLLNLRKAGHVNGMTLTYYAAALNPAGKIGQLFVTRIDGRQVSQEWTGVTYPNMRAAAKSLTALNTR